MNGFQLVGVSIAVIFSGIVLVGLRRRRITLPSALFWWALWLTASVAIVNPELTRLLAEALGIDRGADLVFYFAILAMFIGFFLTYSKLRRLEHTMTRIVRDSAIDKIDGGS